MELKEREKAMIDGILYSAQFVGLSHGLDTIAEELLRESGYTKTDFLESLKRSEHEANKTKKLINYAFGT